MACATGACARAPPRSPPRRARPARRSRGPWRSPGRRTRAAAGRSGLPGRRSRARCRSWSLSPCRPPLERAWPTGAERREMTFVVNREHEEPAETIQIAEVGVPSGPRGVGLAWEVGAKAVAGRRGPGGKGGYTRARRGGRRRAGLAGRTGLGARREAQTDERHAALHDQRVGRDLAETPVVVRAGGELRLGGRIDDGEEVSALVRGALDQEADRLPQPLGPVGRLVGDPQRHSDDDAPLGAEGPWPLDTLCVRAECARNRPGRPNWRNTWLGSRSPRP